MKNKKELLMMLSVILIGLVAVLVIVLPKVITIKKTDNIEYKCKHSYGCSGTFFGKQLCAYKDREGITEDIACLPEQVSNESVVNIYLFRGDGCPHCEHLLEFFDELKFDSAYKYKFNLIEYEVWNNKNNKYKMVKAAEYFDLNNGSIGVPFYIIGNNYKAGFSNPLYLSDEDKKAQEDTIKKMIDDAYYDGYTDLKYIFDK